MMQPLAVRRTLISVSMILLCRVTPPRSADPLTWQRKAAYLVKPTPCEKSMVSRAPRVCSSLGPSRSRSR